MEEITVEEIFMEEIILEDIILERERSIHTNPIDANHHAQRDEMIQRLNEKYPVSNRPYRVYVEMLNLEDK